MVYNSEQQKFVRLPNQLARAIKQNWHRWATWNKPLGRWVNSPTLPTSGTVTFWYDNNGNQEEVVVYADDGTAHITYFDGTKIARNVPLDSQPSFSFVDRALHFVQNIGRHIGPTDFED